MAFRKIGVLGLGKIGALAATLLHKSGFAVTGSDNRHRRCLLPFDCRELDVSSLDALGAALAEFDAVLSCLSYHLNKGVAETAHRLHLHYFDLTEDVPTKQASGQNFKGIMAPQSGVAPGFVGIVGAHLAECFETVRSIRLRVGALPQHPTELLGYVYNWSPEGVVNEYLNDCEVIGEGVHKWVSPMEWIETVYVNGVKLEAFTTSGGLGTMCETYDGKIENIDYKTMRYPGHASLMKFSSTIY